MSLSDIGRISEEIVREMAVNKDKFASLYHQQLLAAGGDFTRITMIVQQRPNMDFGFGYEYEVAFRVSDNSHMNAIVAKKILRAMLLEKHYSCDSDHFYSCEALEECSSNMVENVPMSERVCSCGLSVRKEAISKVIGML